MNETTDFDAALIALDCLTEDLALLASGDWQPDDASCAASFEMVERVRAYLLANKPQTI